MSEYDSINQAVVCRLPDLLYRWFPSGKLAGKEFLVGDIHGNPGESLRVNIVSGRWKDFSSSAPGGDMVSLYAAIKGIKQGEAARELTDLMGTSQAPVTPRKEKPSPVHVPFPAEHKLPAHPMFGFATAAWKYHDASGNVVCYACRFDKPDGSKEVVPLSWSADGKFSWRQYKTDHRPLFNLHKISKNKSAPILVVEGEKCAQIAEEVLKSYIVTTWPGGCGAVEKADWGALKGRDVLVWPDRDRKIDKTTGEELSYEDQPGTIAANKICAKLKDVASQIKLLDVREFKEDGWDIADLVQKEQWGQNDIISWARRHLTNITAPVVAIPTTSAVYGNISNTPTVKREIILTTDYMPNAHKFASTTYVGLHGPIRHYSGCWYLWNGTHYPEIEAAMVRSDAYRWLTTKSVVDSNGTIVNARVDKEIVNKLMDALAATAHLKAEYRAPCWLGNKQGPNPDYCAILENGILDLVGKKLYAHSADFWAHNCVPYKYDPAAPAPVEWLKFMKSTWPNDQECIDTLQEIMGYMLTSDTSQQKIFLIKGPKRSGKGTIARILRALVGSENSCFPTLDSLRNDFGMEQLIGKTLAIFSDVRLDGQTASITEHLLSVSGEDAKSINRKNLKHWNGKLNTRFIMMTNLVPGLKDSSGALASRLIILKMTESKIGKEDTNLTNKLLLELPGIFNWAMVGLDRLMARGKFVNPKSAAEEIREFEELSAPIKVFVSDECIMGPEHKISAAELFEEWTQWCNRNGRDGVGTLMSFTRDLRAQGAGIKQIVEKTLVGSRPHYVGITLKSNVGKEKPTESDYDPWDMKEGW